MTTINLTLYCSVTEYSNLHGLTRDAVIKAINRGALPAITIGSMYYILKADNITHAVRGYPSQKRAKALMNSK